jgi:hypothetical protein
MKVSTPTHCSHTLESNITQPATSHAQIKALSWYLSTQLQLHQEAWWHKLGKHSTRLWLAEQQAPEMSQQAAADAQACVPCCAGV